MEKKAKSKVNAEGKKLKKKVNRDVAKVLNKNTLARGNLLAMNPYLQSLLDPFNTEGAKIPDMVMYKSTPLKIVDRRTLTVSAAGLCGISYGVGGYLSAPAEGSLVPIANVIGSYAVGMTLGPGALVNDLYPSVSGGTYITLQGWGGISDQVPKLFQKARLVSAGVEVQYMGNITSSKGKITLAYSPRGNFRSQIGAGAVSIASLLQLPDSKAVAINRLEGGTVLYKPLDGMSLMYVDLDITPASAYTAQDWDSSVNCVAASGGEMFVIVDGATTGDSVQITAVFNYEAVPRTNTTDIVSVTHSPSDPIALSHAINTIQVTPSTVPKSFTDITADFIGQTSKFKLVAPQNHKKSSFMDKILSGLKTGGDLVKGIAPIAEMFAGLL